MLAEEIAADPDGNRLMGCVNEFHAQYRIWGDRAYPQVRACAWRAARRQGDGRSRRRAHWLFVCF